MDPFRLRVDDDISLQLRVDSDAQAFFSLVDRHRDLFRRYLPWVDETKTLRDEKDYLADCRADFESRKSLDLGILYRKSWVGSIGLLDMDHVNHSAELGYWLAREVHGLHIATRSVRGLVQYGFEQYGLHRIWAGIVPHNEPSKRVMHRTGFTFEATHKDAVKMHGKYHNLLVYRLLKPEWLEQTRPTT